MAKANTTTVVRTVSSRSGHTTLRSSTRAASANCQNSRPYQLSQISPAPSNSPPATIPMRIASD